MLSSEDQKTMVWKLVDSVVSTNLGAVIAIAGCTVLLAFVLFLVINAWRGNLIEIKTPLVYLRTRFNGTSDAGEKDDA